MGDTNLRQSLSYEPVELDFGTSGLRGKIEDMTDLECYINSLGFIKFAAKEGSLSEGATISLGGDLRDSTPRIMKSVARAINDAGFVVENCGLLPTPAIAFWALEKNQACIMVTGSHIPADRNGIKFYKLGGEVLKSDEAAIKKAVSEVREEVYSRTSKASKFNTDGSIKEAPELPEVLPDVTQFFKKRYQDCFNSQLFTGKKVIVYQHSAVGRDLLVELLKSFGAEVVPVDRSEVFIPIDTENITPENTQYFKGLAEKYPDNFAIVSTDGDSDRPFVIDEQGKFYRGDILGAIVSDFLHATFAALPVSANDAVDEYLKGKTEIVHTKIGSPYIIEAMQKAKSEVEVGWEVNGGFLLGCDIEIGGSKFKALPTRDAFLPIFAALQTAVDKGCKLSEVFDVLPNRYTGGGLLDNFPLEKSQKVKEVKDNPEIRAKIASVLNSTIGFGDLTSVDTLDGVRMTFNNGDIVHIRPSGNAPQLRVYTVSNSQERADEIVAQCVSGNEPLLVKLADVLS